MPVKTIRILVALTLLQSVAFSQLKKLSTQTQYRNLSPSRSDLRKEKTSAVTAPGRSVNYSWNMLNNVWDLVDTSLYTYNSQGVLGEMIRVNVHPNFRNLYSYDSKGRLLQNLTQYYDLPNQNWINSSREIIMYDQQDELIEHRYEYYDLTFNNWVISGGYRHNIVYNASNKILINTQQGWNSSAMTWMDQSRYTNYSYNSNGDAIQYEYQIKSGNSWNNNLRINDVYSIFNVLVEEMVEMWNGSAFVKNERYTNVNWHTWTSDPETRAISSYTMYTWGSPLTNQWNLSDRNNTTYDAYGGYVSTYQTYTNSTWVNDSRYSLSFDSRLNETGSKTESWNIPLSSWSIDYQQNIIHGYDFAGNLVQSIWQNWNSTQSVAVNSEKKVYSDFKTITGVLQQDALLQTELKVYPQPFSSLCHFEIKEYSSLHQGALHLSIRDLLGKEVLTLPVESASTPLEKGNLQKGIYFYSLMQQQHTLASGKLLVE